MSDRVNRLKLLVADNMHDAARRSLLIVEDYLTHDDDLTDVERESLTDLRRRMDRQSREWREMAENYKGLLQ